MTRVTKRYVHPLATETSTSYLGSAAALGAKDLDPVFFNRAAKHDFGVQKENVEALLDQAHWQTKRPAIEIRANYNQIGNLIIAWHPSGGAEQFVPTFMGRVEVEFLIRPFNGRPLGELMYVRDQSWTETRTSARAMRSLLLGFAARYRELLEQIAMSIEITKASGMRVGVRGKGTEPWLDVNGAWR